MKGKCYYCNKELTERTIKRHMKNCSEMKKIIKTELESDTKTRNQFIISLKDKYDLSTYCLYISIDADLQLLHLDKVIRDIWVECCGHLSMFKIDDVRYMDNSDGNYQMNTKLKDILHTGLKFEYEYDFGSTTYIVLEVVDVIEVSRKHSQIEVIARNNESNNVCNKCGGKATLYQYETGEFLCEKCADKLDEYEEEFIEELCGDYYNSPRDGVCGYVGNRNAEDVYLPKNNVKYKIDKHKPSLGYGDDLFDYDDSIFDGITNLFDEDDHANYMEAFQEAILKVAKKASRIFMKGIYSFDIKEILSGYTKKQLLDLSDNLNIKIYRTLKKEDYIKFFLDYYEEKVREIINAFTEDKYKIIELGIKNNGVINIGEDTELIEISLMNSGIIFPANYNNCPVYVIPQVVQDIINKNEIELKRRIRINSEQVKLIRGIMNVYGIVSCSNIIELFSKYGYKLDDVANLINLLEENALQFENADYCVCNSNNVPIFFVNGNIEDYEEAVKEIDNNKPYKDFTKEKLLEYGDRKYLEHSKIGKRFIKDILDLFSMTKEQAVISMNYMSIDIQKRTYNEIVSDIIEGTDCDIDYKDQIVLKELIGNFVKNIPLWKYKGYSIDETENNSVCVKTSKIGRNDLCTCGSGKKYKNCCGKVINLFERQ